MSERSLRQAISFSFRFPFSFLRRRQTQPPQPAPSSDNDIVAHKASTSTHSLNPLQSEHTSSKPILVLEQAADVRQYLTSSLVPLPIPVTQPPDMYNDSRGYTSTLLSSLGIPSNHDLTRSLEVPILPIEIIDQITSFADSATLVALSAVNQAYQGVSERIIYRKIVCSTPTKTIKCLKTMDKRPSLAHYTLSYEIGDLEDDSEPLPAFFSLLSRVLHRMTRLSELIILLDGPFVRVLAGCPFRLTRLTSALNWDAAFVDWLNEQSELRVAFFCGKHVAGATLNSQALPNLTRISASPLILAAAVPGRPVKNVEICLVHPWLLNEGLMTTTMKIMAFSTGPLNTLQIITRLNDTTSDVLASVGVIPRILSTLDSLAFHAVSGSITPVSTY